MAGRRQRWNQSFITSVTAYRTSIATADATGPTGVSAVTGYMDLTNTDYAAETTLNILIFSSQEGGEGITGAYQLWFGRTANGPWAYVQDLNVTKHSQLFKIAATAGYYKVICTDKNAATVDIYYQWRK